MQMHTHDAMHHALTHLFLPFPTSSAVNFRQDQETCSFADARSQSSTDKYVMLHHRVCCVGIVNLLLCFVTGFT